MSEEAAVAPEAQEGGEEELKQGEDDQAEPESKGRDSQGSKKEEKIIKNVVHIDQKGANINITNINNHQTFVIYANR